MSQKEHDCGTDRIAEAVAEMDVDNHGPRIAFRCYPRVTGFVRGRPAKPQNPSPRVGLYKPPVAPVNTVDPVQVAKL